MAFSIPKLPELVQRARQNFRTYMPGSDAWIWPNNLNVASKVMAALTHELFLWLKYIEKQRFVTTADGEFLDRHGQQYAIARLAPSFSEGEVVFVGTPTRPIPAGLEIDRTDGVRYTVTEAAIVSGLGSVTLKVRAQAAGKSGNAIAATPVSLLEVNDDLTSSGTVPAAGIGLGADEESDESLRQRILHRLQYPPHGGAAHDYVAWARSIAGVTRVFVEPAHNGPGTVGVYFLMDGIYTHGIPQQADVAAVDAFIETVRPVTAVVSTLAPTTSIVDIEVRDLAPNTVAVQEAVRAELQDLFTREVGVGTDTTPFTLYRSKIWQAVADATGEDHHDLIVPSINVVYTGGQIPVLGDVTFTAS